MDLHIRYAYLMWLPDMHIMADMQIRYFTSVRVLVTSSDRWLAFKTSRKVRVVVLKGEHTPCGAKNDAEGTSMNSRATTKSSRASEIKT